HHVHSTPPLYISPSFFTLPPPPPPSTLFPYTTLFRSPAISGVPASNLFGSSAYSVFSNFTDLIMSPPPMYGGIASSSARLPNKLDRKSTRLNSSHSQISYAVFCLKKKKKK